MTTPWRKPLPASACTSAFFRPQPDTETADFLWGSALKLPSYQSGHKKSGLADSASRGLRPSAAVPSIPPPHSSALLDVETLHPVPLDVPGRRWPPCPQAQPYRRRKPETTSLYRVVQEHLETYLAQTPEADPADPEPVPDLEFDQSREGEYE